MAPPAIVMDARTWAFGVRMKKIVLLFLALCLMAHAFSQEKKLSDSQIKDALVRQNAFGDYLKCNADNTFVSHYRTRGGDGYHFEGAYQIKNGIVSFSNVSGGNFGDHVIFTDNNGTLDLDSEYRYLPEKYNDNFLGCLCNIEDKSCLWTVKEIPEDMPIEINGIKAHKVRKEIYIKENLKMRSQPSLNSKTVEIKGCDFNNGWVEGFRKVVFKGMIITPIAKTAETETIDGITAPWYYILQQDHDPSGRNDGDVYYVWIFGGYVQEYPKNTMTENPETIQQSVKSIGLKFYQHNYNHGDKS